MTEGSSQSKSLFAQFFSLHPLDAFEYSLAIQQEMEDFVDAFKQRIEVQIQYSRSLFKIGKMLQKHIKPDSLSPVSYICSAFNVEHEQRGRHALQLAEYLHTEIEVICQTVLLSHQQQKKRNEKILKKWYKDADNCEETFQKNLRKYVKSKQDWQERVITKNILLYTPGASQSQKQKAISKAEEGKNDSQAYFDKYIDSLQAFNDFALGYNEQIGAVLSDLESSIKQELLVQADSLRKLIVSEVSMFKNIEYDLLNISKQMEDLSLPVQVELFVNENKQNFVKPIMPAYGDGQVDSEEKSIGYKVGTTYTLMEETLLCIESAQFNWMHENKNSTMLRYSLARIWKKLCGEQQQGGSSDYLANFQQIVKTNRIVKEMRMDNEQQITQKLHPEEAYSISFKILTNIANLCRRQHYDALQSQEKVELLRSYFSLHHFYRFIGLVFLQEYAIMHANRIEDAKIVGNFVQIAQAILLQAYQMKDVFVIRGIISLIFSCYWVELEVNCFLFRHPDLSKLLMWRSAELWEAAVFEDHYEKIILLSTGERSELQDVYIMRQKNVVFSGLVSYSHYMIMLGFDAKETRQIIGRSCQLYSLSEEHERDLAKSISNSERQYLQTLVVK